MIIRYTNTAKPLTDIQCSEISASIVLNLLRNINVDTEFCYSNELFLHCLRAELYKTDKKLVNKIKWYVEDIELHFDENLRSIDAWNHLPCLMDKCLITLLGD